MKKILVLNGPNINLIGIREKEIYGSKGYEQIVNEIIEYGSECGFDTEVKQSNHEGDLVDWIQQAYFNQVTGIIINAGGYTHTSIAIMDAIKSIAPIPVIEVHFSDINTREDFRKHSYISLVSAKTICGYGEKGYLMAIGEIANIVK